MNKQTLQYIEQINAQTNEDELEELIQKIIGDGGYYDTIDDAEEKEALLNAASDKQDEFYGKIEPIKGGGSRAKEYFSK